MRNMGVTAYDVRVFRKVLEKFPPDRIAYVARLFAELLPQGLVDLCGVEYIGDWLHFETPQDFNKMINDK